MFYCTLCGQSITGNETFYGTEFSCPACNARVAIPAPPGAATPAAAARPVHAPVSTPPSAAPAPEMPLAAFAPALRAYTGRLVLAGLLLAAALAALLMLWNYAAWWQVITALAALAALYLLLGAWLHCKSVRYALSSQRLTIISGLLSKRTDELELFRVKDVLVTQSMWQRLLNYGSVTILSTDDSTPHLTMAGLRAPLQVKEMLRDAYRLARQAAGLRATEFIQS